MRCCRAGDEVPSGRSRSPGSPAGPVRGCQARPAGVGRRIVRTVGRVIGRAAGRATGVVPGLCLVLVVALGLSPVSAARPAAAEPLRVPSLSGTERGAIITMADNGAVRWRAEWTREATVADGKPVVRFTETGQGHYGAFEQEVRWTLEAVWTAVESFSPLRVDRIVRDAGGRLLMRERKAFDFSAGVARFERQDATGRTILAKAIGVPRDTLAVEGIGTALRALPFDPPRPFDAHLLTNEPKLYRVTLAPRGRERIRTPAGTFDCYKVEMIPHLGLLGMFRPFVPKTYFWFTVEPPHFWVRYEGLETGLGSPRVVMDLTEFERHSADGPFPVSGRVSAKMAKPGSAPAMQ